MVIQIYYMKHRGEAPFNIIPNPTELAKRDEILKQSVDNLIYFGRAFLPNDFLNKSESPDFHFHIAKKLLDH